MIKKYTVDEVLPILDGVKGSNGKYTAHCPAHTDNKSSLSLTTGDNGEAVLCCHAGCNQREVWGAIYDKLGRPEQVNTSERKTKKRLVKSYY